MTDTRGTILNAEEAANLQLGRRIADGSLAPRSYERAPNGTALQHRRAGVRARVPGAVAAVGAAVVTTFVTTSSCVEFRPRIRTLRRARGPLRLRVHLGAPTLAVVAHVTRVRKDLANASYSESPVSGLHRPQVLRGLRFAKTMLHHVSPVPQSLAPPALLFYGTLGYIVRADARPARTSVRALTS